VKSGHAESGACVPSHEAHMHRELSADVANLDECGYLVFWYLSKLMIISCWIS
jgi:hypothetical protein